MANSVHTPLMASESHLGSAVGRTAARPYLFSRGPAMGSVEGVLTDVAPTSIPIILVGESGSGKDALALQIHQMSGRAKEPFVKVACFALTPEILMGFLDGNGNNGNGSGSGHPGTLFLDDVFAMDAACQARLLSVLPDGAGIRMDGALDARLVCATSHGVEEHLRGGQFREELFFRMNGICLRIPPLRHRREDIPLLLAFFVERFAEEFGRPCPVISARTLQVAADHPWPGNVRQLENFARRVVLFGDEKAVAEELQDAAGSWGPAGGNGNHATVSLKETSRAASRQAERELILKTLAQTRWNRKKAAEMLQISYKALLYKLKDIGADQPSSS